MTGAGRPAGGGAPAVLVALLAGASWLVANAEAFHLGHRGGVHAPREESQQSLHRHEVESGWPDSPDSHQKQFDGEPPASLKPSMSIGDAFGALVLVRGPSAPSLPPARAGGLHLGISAHSTHAWRVCVQ